MREEGESASRLSGGVDGRTLGSAGRKREGTGR